MAAAWPLLRLKLKLCTTPEPRLGTITKPSEEAEKWLPQAISKAIATTSSAPNSPWNRFAILRLISIPDSYRPGRFALSFRATRGIWVLLASDKLPATKTQIPRSARDDRPLKDYLCHQHQLLCRQADIAVASAPPTGLPLLFAEKA